MIYYVHIMGRNEPIEITSSQYTDIIKALNDKKDMILLPNFLIKLASISLIEGVEEKCKLLNWQTGQLEERQKNEISLDK